MQRICFVLALLAFSLNFPSEQVWAQGGRDLSNFKGRMNKALDTPREKLKAMAEQPVCKGDKKPICYTEAMVISQGWGMVRITRPEADKHYFVLLQAMPDATWKIALKGPIEKLTVEHLNLEQTLIPTKLAKKMIAALKLR
jgi:hypothetical protein